jgi:hypothetical protein
MNFSIGLLLALFIIKTATVVIEKMDNQFERKDMSDHLRKLSESSLLGVTATATGYFYAKYYSKSNCSGILNYVEGYATGVCMPRINMISRIQIGSIIQTCTNMGKSYYECMHTRTWQVIENQF